MMLHLVYITLTCQRTLNNNNSRLIIQHMVDTYVLVLTNGM